MRSKRSAPIRVSYWLIVLPLFYYAVFLLLRQSYPVTWDGGGPMPDFFCWECPAPSPDEYHRDEAFYEGVYRRPYHKASFVITLLVCPLTQLIVGRTPVLRKRRFLSSAAFATLALLSLAATVHFGWLPGVWKAKVFVLDGELLIRLGKLFVLVSLMAGIAGTGYGLVERLVVRLGRT